MVGDIMNHKKALPCFQKKSEELSHLSTEALNAEIDFIMEQDASTMDIPRLKQCLKLLQERNPVAIPSSPDEAWSKFVEHCPPLNGEPVADEVSVG